jgi:hypothetical protein
MPGDHRLASLQARLRRKEREMSRKAATSAALLVALTVSLALTAVANAQGSVSVTIGSTARLVENGAAVLVPVEITCSVAGGEVLEAHLRVSQDEQAISGEAGINHVKCDGNRHRYMVRVSPLEGQFHLGDASASALVLVLTPEGFTVQGQASRTVTVA